MMGAGLPPSLFDPDFTTSGLPGYPVAVNQRCIPGHKGKRTVFLLFESDLSEIQDFQETDSQMMLFLNLIHSYFSIPSKYTGFRD
jgi:hypothetical protein